MVKKQLIVFFKTLGINIEKDLEGYFQKTRSIKVWLANGINLDKFCRNESIRVNSSVKTGFIRPAGKKEVTVSISGLEFNTPDTFVMSYLAKFGTVVTTSVIYDRYKEGPFKGKYNGERKYQVDFTKSSISMGTYHIMDGERVRVHYPGNKKTCGRCHQTAELCKGGAVAKDCEENDGIKVSLYDHMRKVWENIGFQPTEFQLDMDDDINDAIIRDANKFSPKIAHPKPTEEDTTKYNGVVFKNFPKESKKVDIINFLKANGLPEDFSNDNIVFGNHGNVEVRSIISQACQQIIKNIHFPETRQKFFGKPIYCRATRDLTPEKLNENIPEIDKRQVVDEQQETAKKPVDDEQQETAKKHVDDEQQENPAPSEKDKQNEAAALETDDLGFVYEPAEKIDSKLLNGSSDESGESSDENPDPALKFLKSPKSKTPANCKKRSRATPSSTSDKKTEKKKTKIL